MIKPRIAFGIDVEDPRLLLGAGGAAHRPQVPRLTEAYLDFLDSVGGTGTFFIVGDVARAHPELVARIAAAGHEIACHSDRHVPLAMLGPDGFREDTLRNLDALAAAGAGPVTGYRAPCFSLTAETRWAFAILAELGFEYSSSVLPARNPISGWPGFGTAARRIDGLVELPVTLLSRLLPLPFGGAYFRALPWPLLAMALRARRRSGAPILTYHHPYDLDPDQEFDHPGFARWSPYGLVMHAGRAKVVPRLRKAAALGFEFVRYDALAARAAHAPAPAPYEGSLSRATASS